MKDRWSEKVINADCCYYEKQMCSTSEDISLVSIPYSVYREKPWGNVPAGSAGEEKQRSVAVMTFSEKRGIQLLRGTTWCPWAFKKLQPCGSHLAVVYVWTSCCSLCWSNQGLWCQALANELAASSFWSGRSVQSESINAGPGALSWPIPTKQLAEIPCSSLTKMGELWESLVSCLWSVWISVSCCMLGLNDLLSVTAWWSMGEGF